MKSLQESFAVQLLGVFEDTLILVLDRRGCVVLAGDNSTKWIYADETPNGTTVLQPEDLIGREVSEIPRVKDIPDVEDAVSLARSGARTLLHYLPPGEKLGIRGHVEPIMARGTQGSQSDAPVAERGSRTSFKKGQSVGALLVLRDEKRLLDSIDIIDLLGEKDAPIDGAASAGASSSESVASSQSSSSEINWGSDIKDVFSSFLRNMGNSELELSLWMPDEDEGAKLVSYSNGRNQEPLELLMTATMLFAMDEAGQVDQKQFALRVMEDSNALVSIRDADGGKLMGAVIFNGPKASEVDERLALKLGERAAQELIENAFADLGL